MPITHPNDIALITLDEVGEVSQLRTTAKTVVSAINELYSKNHLSNIVNGTNSGAKCLGASTSYNQGSYSFVFSYGGYSNGNYAFTTGYCCKATASYSMATGYYSLASGQASFAEGHYTQATSTYCHAEGYYCYATNTAAHAEGYQTRASGQYSHAQNSNTTASGIAANAGGYYCTASGNYSFTQGYYLQAKYCQTVIGRCNTVSNASDTTYNTQFEAFIIGNGADTANRANAFKVHFDGNVFADGTYSSPAADYAEFFEWKDGNPHEDDRTGLFVKLDCGKLVLAETFDTPFGIVSATPAIVGDSAEFHWNGKFETDDFGRLKYDMVTIPAKVDGDGNTIEEERVEWRPVLSADFDAAKDYTPRAARPEWSPVGVLGKLVVFDDGTLQPGDYCRVGSGGVAAKAIKKGYPVLKRVAEDKVLIWFSQGVLL